LKTQFYNRKPQNRHEALQDGRSDVGLEARVSDVVRHAPQDSFDLWLKRGIFPDHPTERPLESRRENQFVHGLLCSAKAGDNTRHRLAFQFAGTKGFDRTLCFDASTVNI
jgi:hypothetical protein